MQAKVSEHDTNTAIHGHQNVEVLTFREQEDGKKVGFIGTKVVIITLERRDMVHDGETWEVVLSDKGKFFIGFPVRRVERTVRPSEEASVNVVCLECFGRSLVPLKDAGKWLMTHAQESPSCGTNFAIKGE